MSIKVEKTDNKNELKLEFTVAAEKFEDAMKKVYFQTAKYFNIPGFRKGKAPMKIVEKYYGESIFYEDAFNEILKEEYDKELKENDITAVSYPEFDIKQMEKGKDLIFTATVQVKPEVKLGKYKGIELKKVEYTVKDEDINHELGHMQERNSRIVTVEDKPVEKGNIAVIDFEGFVDEKAFEGGKAEGYELEIGSNTFIPGFEDQIIGMSKDEEKDINVTFPEDYHSEDLKGQKVVFKVKVNEIKTTKIPELDKDFFEDLAMEGIDSKESLEKQLEENIKAHKEQHAEDHYIDELLKKGIENMEVDIPEAMINEELDRMIRQYEENLKMQGLTLQQFYQFTNSDEAALKDQMKEEAEKRVASRLLLEAIKVEEKIEIADDEAKKEAEELAKKYNMEKDEFLKLFGGIEMVKYDMEMRRAIEILKENN